MSTGTKDRPPALTPRRQPHTVPSMRTTIDVPSALLAEARRLLGVRTNSEVIELSIREVIRRRRIADLKAMFGTMDLAIDLPKSRRRPRRR